MGNKSKERDCLKKVLQYSKQSRGKVKQFLQSLATYDIQEDERPDFIFVNRGIECIGLEHFVVDHLSQKNTNDKVASNGILERKIYDDFVAKCVENTDLSDQMLDELFDDFIKILCSHAGKSLSATYPTFIEAFKYSLNTHLSKVEEYRANLRMKYSDKIYLGFLIEVHSEFEYLFLNNSRGTQRVKFGYLPIFYDIIQTIKQSCNGKIDFIILYSGEKMYKNSDKVRVFSIKNIERDLERQGERIYLYASEDCALAPFQSMQEDLCIKPEISHNDQGYNVVFNFSRRDMCKEDILDLMHFAFYRACWAKAHRKDFACSPSMLCLLEVYAKYVIGWDIPENEEERWKVKPKFRYVPQEVVDEELSEFNKKWGINTNDET